MPSLSLYKKTLGSYTNGQVRKNQSDMIMDATWWEDISSRKAYLCDFYHDKEILLLNDLHPEKDNNKIPIDIKFLQHTSQTYDKDQVTFHLQLRPNQECNIPYYKECFEDRYGAMFPIGLYAIIQDEKGIWNRWLVVDKANINVTQFPTYEILKCDYIFQYIMDNKKVQIPGVLRSQNSYNSGLWTDHVITTIEDQQKFAVPLNRDTEKIWYTENSKNLRMIIDGKVITEPRCWKVSKVNRISPNGISRITLAQTPFNAQTDYIELDDNGNVIGMWADYYSSTIEPIEPEIPQHNIRAEITYSGIKPEIKIGGNYKKFTVTFFENNEEISHKNGVWKFSIDGQDALDKISILTSSDSTDVADNQIKIKFKRDESYIGKNMIITFSSDDGIKAEIEVALVAL